MTKDEKRIVYSVFDTIIKEDFEKLEFMFASDQLKEMKDLYHKIKYEKYCKDHGLSSYKQMTMDDYIRFAEEKDVQKNYYAEEL